MSIRHECAVVYSRAQHPDLNTDAYVRKLFELSEHTGFADREESILDRLVVGVGDRELSEHFSSKQN